MAEAKKKTYAIADPSYTVTAFCAAEDFSKSHLYKMWRAGTGPEFYWVGVERRITHRARLDFQRAREAAAKSAAQSRIAARDGTS